MVNSQENFKLFLGICRDFKGVDLNDSDLQKLVSFVCGRFCGNISEVIHFEISIAIVDDAQIREFNEKYLGKARVTDCLSFDLSEPDEAGRRVCEIMVNGEEALRQSKRRSHSAEAELALYIVHGLLHNFGFDDGQAHQAKRMHSAENDILQELGYGIVYNNGYKDQ